MTIVSRVEGPPQKIMQGFRDPKNRLFSAAISDAMGMGSARGVMVNEIKPVFEGARLIGPALTVRSPGDLLTILKAIDLAKQGDVLVIDGQGRKDTALLGEIMSRSAQIKGIEGIVIDGATRDVAAITELKFPVFCRAATPAVGTFDFVGDINVPIQCGGVNVEPGDIIFGDDDGVVVVPKKRAEEILETARLVVKAEEIEKEKIEKGLTPGQMLGVDKIMQERKKKPIAMQLTQLT